MLKLNRQKKKFSLELRIRYRSQIQLVSGTIRKLKIVVTQNTKKKFFFEDRYLVHLTVVQNDRTCSMGRKKIL
jgi:hypothetical protein